MYSYLDDLEQRSIYIIREAFNRIDRQGLQCHALAGAQSLLRAHPV